MAFLADMGARQMRERADGRALLHRDTRAEHHIGLDRDVPAELGVRREVNRVGGDEGDAGFERRLPQPLLHGGLGRRKLRFGVDAAHFILRHFERDRPELHVARNLHRIGQIELAFAVGIADPLQDFQRRPAVECHQPAVAERDGAFLFAGVGMLDDGDEFRPLRHQTAVAGRVRGLESQNRDRGAIGDRAAKLVQRLRLNERRIAEHHHNVVSALFDGGFGRQNRMRGAAAFFLHEHL